MLDQFEFYLIKSMWKLAHPKVVINIWIIFYTHHEKSMNEVTLTGHINAITNSLVLKWKCTVRSCRWWNKPTFLKVHFCKEGISLTFYIFLHFKTDHKRAFNVHNRLKSILKVHSYYIRTSNLLAHGLRTPGEEIAFTAKNPLPLPNF